MNNINKCVLKCGSYKKICNKRSCKFDELSVLMSKKAFTSSRLYYDV